MIKAKVTFPEGIRRKKSVPEPGSRLCPRHILVHGRGPVIVAEGTSEFYTHLTPATGR